MIKVKEIRHGQVAAYKDDVSVYEIDSDEGFEATKKHCMSLTNVKNETKDESQCDGSSGWPFGLDSFFWFGQKGPEKYSFKVVSPFND